jgi:protein ImuB
LPKASLLSRFGEQLGKRLGQFSGDVAETIVPHRPPPEFIVERELEHPEERLQAVEQLVRELVEHLAGLLAERREGAVRLTCQLYTPAPSIVQLGLFRPTANPTHLWDLLKLQLKPLGPVGRVVLAATLTAPLEHRQGELFGNGQQDAERHVALLIDRLCSRLGSSAVLRAKRTADPLPERAVAFVPLLEAGKQKERPPLNHRPLRLYSPPRQLSVMSVAPDGPPISFVWNHQPNTISRWWGPERIEAGWWRGPTVRRDYYSVEVEGGDRFWLFRNLSTGKWFLHGEFT